MLTTYESDALADWAGRRREFRERFRRNKRSNLSRRWRGSIVTVFHNESTGSYAWAISTGKGVRYSRYRFRTEDGAIDDLMHELERKGR